MNTLHYGHLALALVYLAWAILFLICTLGKAPRWPFLAGGGEMSQLLRWLVAAWLSVSALWELARGLFYLQVSVGVLATHALFFIAVIAVNRRDRRRSPAKSASMESSAPESA